MSREPKNPFQHMSERELVANLLKSLVAVMKMFSIPSGNKKDIETMFVHLVGMDYLLTLLLDNYPDVDIDACDRISRNIDTVKSFVSTVAIAKVSERGVKATRKALAKMGEDVLKLEEEAKGRSGTDEISFSM